MLRILRRLVHLNLRFALRQIARARRLSSDKLGEEFARSAYLEIYTTLRYVYLVLPVVYLPFALYDIITYTLATHDVRLIIFNGAFYVVLGIMIFVFNFGRLHRGSFRRLRMACRIGVGLLACAGTGVTIILFDAVPDLSIFSATLLATAALFRFPDATRYVLYAVNYAALYGFFYYRGVDHPSLIQNPLFVLFMILVFDRVTYLTLASRYLKERRIYELNQLLVQEDVNKTDVLSIAVHDLKSPITGILSVSRLVAETGESFPPQEQREILRDIEDSCRGILHTVEDLIDIASTRRSSVQLRYERFDLIPVLHAAVEGYGYQASLKRIRVETGTERPRAFVHSDRHAVQRVLDNLVSNAVKYTAPGGTVGIRVERLPADHRFVRLTISDEGPGFTPEDRRRMFARFQRLSARPTGGESSTGVGLFIVYKLIEVLEGASLELESRVGHGSTFHVRLPRSQKWAGDSAATALARSIG